MTEEVSIEECIQIVRPVIGEHRKDFFDIPIMNTVTEDMIEVSTIEPLNIQNLSSKKNNTNKLVLSFISDERLARYWNAPLKYIPVLQSAYAVATPDFSIHEQMGFPE